MFYYLYKITNNINNKIYVGIHKTVSLNDGYFGSGLNINRAIKKYGKENFIKEILEFFNNEQEMFAREKDIVNSNFINDPTTYNIVEGGHGSFSYINSLPNQGHRTGQQKEASLIKSAKLKNDSKYRDSISKKLSKSANKQVAEGKMFFQSPSFINPASFHKWISNDTEEKSLYVPREKLDSYVENGWYLGRKYKPTNLGKKHKKRN
jgi:hypothetical protein